MSIDLYANVSNLRLMLDNRDKQGSETVTETGISMVGRSGHANACVLVNMDANCAAADTCIVTIEKCTDAAGTGATTIATGTTRAGTSGAQEFQENLVVPLHGLGGLGTTYDFLRAKAVIVDGNNSGIINVAVVLSVPALRQTPANT